MKTASFKFFLLLMITLTLNVSASPSRMTNPSYVRLPDHVPDQKALSKAVFLQPLEADREVSLTLVLPLRNQEELEDLVQRMYDPDDVEHYGKYLSSEEFIERFAPTQEDYDKVIAYANELGLSVDNTHSNRTLLNVRGTANVVEEGFKLNLCRYRLKSGRYVFAPNENPAVPVDIAPLLQGVVGLDNWAVWKSYKKQHHSDESVLNPHADSNVYPSGPRGGFAPNDLVIAYNLAGVSAKGAGQKIALFQLASYQISDIETYTNHFGLPAPKIRHIRVNGGSGAGIDAEVALDIELALALAPESKILVYEGPNSYQGVLNTYNRIATDNIAKQVSTSWGLTEDLSSKPFLKAENAIFLQMAAHGQTIYAASGDNGAYDNPNKMTLAVDDPAAQPYIVGVGGTKLTVNAQTCNYEAESVWNHGLGQGGGGGGVSKVWPIPNWQKRVPTAASTTHRNVPDVALNADPSTGYAIFYNGRWEIYGGTSCAAPLWAAFTARVNQERKALNKPVLGFANPILYAIGLSEHGSTAFHDIKKGNNAFYQAVKSYDNATGWGAFNGANLFVNLTNRSQIPFQTHPTALSPHLAVQMNESSPFKKGKTGFYVIDVSNSGKGATSGEVSVKITLPSDLSYSSHDAQGWKFHRHALTFTRNDPLNAGSSYPQIKLYAKVRKSASPRFKASVTVSGGGSDSTSVTCSSRLKG